MRSSTQVRESALTVTFGLIAYGLGLLTGPLLARTLGPTGRGNLAAVLVPGQLFGYLVLLGVHLAAAYYSNEHEEGELVASGTALVWAIGSPFVVLAWILIPRFLAGHDPVTIAWLRLFLVVDLLSVPPLILLQLVRAKAAGRRFNVLRSLAVLLNAAAVLALFVIHHLRLEGALVVAVGSVALANVVVLVRCRPRTRLRVSPALAWKMLRYGSGVTVGSVADQVVARFDQFLLVGLVAPAQLGIYAVAVNAASASIPVGQGAAMALLPQRRRGPTAAIGWRTAKGVAAISIAIAIGVAIVAPLLIPLVYGGAYKSAIYALWIILPGQVLADVATVLNGDLIARGHTGRSSFGVIGAAIVTIVSLPFLVTRMGIEGAALATTLSYVAFLVITIIVVRRTRDDPGDRRASVVEELRLEEQARALGGHGETGVG